MLADFTVTVHEARKPLAVRVKVHDNLAALQGAATRFDKQRRKEDNSKDYLGICHRFHLRNDPVCALIRLAPPHIGVGVLSHEMAHAAVWMWEIHHKFSRKVPLTCANDELFCWILGELVRASTKALYEQGVY